MPIFTINNSKLAVMCEDKSRGISAEFPKDMGLGELLDRVNELRDAVLKGIAEEQKTKDAPKEEPKEEPKAEEKKD